MVRLRVGLAGLPRAAEHSGAKHVGLNWTGVECKVAADAAKQPHDDRDALCSAVEFLYTRSCIALSRSEEIDKFQKLSSEGVNFAY